MNERTKSLVIGISVLALLLLVSQPGHAQRPSRGRMGGGGMGRGGGGGGSGMRNFTPTITNSLRQGGQPPSSLSSTGLYGQARKEASKATSKHMDPSLVTPLRPKTTGSQYESAGARRLLERLKSSDDDEPSESPFRIPPGLREVKESRRAASQLTRPEPDEPQ